MNCKLVYSTKSIKDKDSKEKSFKNYYLVFDNGVRLAVKPSFVTDYAKISVLAEKDSK